jgi:RNA polymerase sigma-70 factor (ECF subfamily)
MDHVAEQAVIQRLRAGDAQALEVLMESYAPRIYRLVHGILGNAADAEEVVQDVFLTLFRKIHTFEERAALGSWLYRVATNAALGRRRGRRTDRENRQETLARPGMRGGHGRG